jgi:mannose-6-phosphate isomerase-like protein (cupin superfamily)
VAGVLTLVRLKLTLLRRSMTGSRGDWMVAGAVVGTGLAVSTIVLSALYRASPAILGDLLGVIYALWLAGWIVGPVWGGAPLVRAEHFALIPVPPRRLAVGLLGTAFAGITTAVTLLAFISLVVFGARLGVLPALVAVPVVVLQLVLVVLLSRLAVTVFGQVARSRIGSAVVGVLVAGLLILSQSGWMLAVAVRTSGLLSTGVTPAFATLVRALPSGWGLYAVEAAGRSDWLTAVGVLAGLAAAIALLLAWSWKLGSPRAARATIRGARRVRIRRAGPLSGAVGAVAVKELRTWWRDPLRVQTIAVSLPWALGTCLLPLTFGSKVLLPWAGPAMALTAVTSSVNLYGQDGTALWLTLVIPGAERNDVHGRQRASLFLFGPVVTVAAVALTALAGPAWTWPWVLALTPALFGDGIGLLAWMSIAALAPSPDPHCRPDNPMDNAGGTGPTYVMFWVALLPCFRPSAWCWQAPCCTARRCAGPGCSHCSRARCRPGPPAPPLHLHTREDEMLYVLEGTLLVQIGGERHELGAGGFVWIPRNTPHTFANAAATPLRGLTLAVPGGLEELLAEQGEYVAQLRGAPDPAELGRIGARHGSRLLGAPITAPGAPVTPDG